VVGDIVETAEYADGTGGGNRYEIVAAATGTADGGSFIDVTGPSTAVQAKALWFDEVRSIRQFGATGEGVVDDTVAIQAALTTGNDTFLPKGTYITSSPLKTGGSGQVIFGEGWQSVIKSTDATLQFQIAVITAHIDVHIHSLKLLGASTSSETSPLSNGAIGTNTNAAATAFQMTYPTTQNGRTKVWDVWMDQWNVGVANNLSDGLDVSYCLFTNIEGINTNYGYGITSSGKNQNITYNRFDNTDSAGQGRHSVYLNGHSESCNVVGNYTKAWEKNPYNFKAELSATSGFWHSIRDNVAEDCNFTEVSRAANFYMVGTSSTFTGGYCTLSSNKTIGCKGHVVRMDYHPHSTVEDCSATNHGSYSTPTFNNSPFYFEFSDYTKAYALSVDEVGGTSNTRLLVMP